MYSYNQILSKSEESRLVANPLSILCWLRGTKFHLLFEFTHIYLSISEILFSETWSVSENYMELIFCTTVWNILSRSTSHDLNISHDRSHDITLRCVFKYHNYNICVHTIKALTYSDVYFKYKKLLIDY